MSWKWALATPGTVRVLGDQKTENEPANARRALRWVKIMIRGSLGCTFGGCLEWGAF